MSVLYPSPRRYSASGLRDAVFRAFERPLEIAKVFARLEVRIASATTISRPSALEI